MADDRNKSRFPLIALALLLCVGAGVAWWQWQEWREREAQAEALRLALETDLAKRLDRARSGTGVPGVSAAIALPDGRVSAAASGFADVEREDPMTPQTLFVAGSVGKSLHAALVLSLDREGVLDLDAPIERWVGDAAWFSRLPNGPELTLRRLLQHSSGLVDHIKTPHFWVKSLIERVRDDADALLTPEELLEAALDRSPEFAPGEGFLYGDTNYVLVGLVVERATGASAFDLIEERLLEPLGLGGIVAARSREIPGLAAGYQLPVNPFLLPPKIAEAGLIRVHPMNESTAGGFATNPSGVVRWAAALFQERALPGPYLEDLVGKSVPTSDGRRYGLGVYLYDTPLGEAWGHGGYFPGYRSGLLYLPEARIGVSVQINRDHLFDVDALMLEIAEHAVEATR